MKLQVSFDLQDIDKAILIAKNIEKYVDIFEIGSTLIVKYGLEAVKKFKKNFPDKEIYADVKLVDRVEDTIKEYTQAGANCISILAGITNNIIQNAAQIAHENNCKIALDLVDSHSLGQSAMDSKSLDIDRIIFHGPHEEQMLETLLEEWENVKGNTDTPIFIEGGINKNSINKILELKPDGIIIGAAITHSGDPAKDAEFFKNILKK
ncbi:orotidine 5'-phosphate decarboxylase [Candidatus Dependentiae bacterium]|nr:orotidine 5'-phosphate decarboxylase [Candidatus Dependentiae bacterium]MBU4386978.1 orotidine 5'-phosphate decarboxylase [Candidatus Dependentiae bacterium]MCG2756126.1 orotidine 5'-phosphate decarboxylase [Candidatus Dependentiae bacterium]